MNCSKEEAASIDMCTRKLPAEAKLSVHAFEVRGLIRLLVANSSWFRRLQVHSAEKQSRLYSAATCTRLAINFAAILNHISHPSKISK